MSPSRFINHHDHDQRQKERKTSMMIRNERPALHGQTQFVSSVYSVFLAVFSWISSQIWQYLASDSEQFWHFLFFLLFFYFHKLALRKGFSGKQFLGSHMG